MKDSSVVDNVFPSLHFEAKSSTTDRQGLKKLNKPTQLMHVKPRVTP